MKISVILPCYNGERWINQAITSVLSQSYDDLELIIINDGSIDASEEIIKKYLYDKRIRLFSQQNNGFSATLNKGIKESTGELIGFIGQDDLWLPQKLDVQAMCFKRNCKLDLLFSSYYNMDNQGRILELVRPKKLNKQKGLWEQLFLTNFIGFETVLVKRKCFDKVGLFDEQMIGFSDHEMWLRIVAEAFNLNFLDIPLVKKRLHKKQLSKSSHILDDEFLLVKKAIGHYPLSNCVYSTKLASLYYVRGLESLYMGKMDSAKKDMLQAVKLDPFNPKHVIAYIAPTWYSLFLKYYQTHTHSKN